MTRAEKIAGLQQEIVSLQKQLAQRRAALAAEQLALRRDALKAHVGRSVKYTACMMIGGPAEARRLPGKVGLLEEVYREYALVDFGAELGRWRLPLRTLETVPGDDEAQARA